MMIRVSRAAIVIASVGMLVSPWPSNARPLGTVDGMPFWGYPYPFGYVYHRPPEECIQVRQIELPFQPPVTEVTVVCGSPPVSARY